MPIGTSAAIAVGGGLLSGIFGGGRGKTTGRTIAPASQLEQFAGTLTQDQLERLRGLIDVGPGEADVAAGAGAQRDLGSLLASLAETGGLPTGADISAAQQQAGGLFAARRLGLQQAFQDQEQAAARQAAALGRDVADPILQARLRTEQARQTGLLGAEESALGTQIAQQLPLQRLGFTAQRSDLLGGLGQQALQNRVALAGLGSQLSSGLLAARSGAGASSTTTEIGGSENFFTRFLAGAGTAGSAFSGFSKNK